MPESYPVIAEPSLPTDSVTSPLPILEEWTRARMRADEQRFLRRRFFRPWLPIPDPAPLPPVNPWCMVADRLAADATIARTVKPVLKKKPVVPTRAAFRKGTLTLTDEGFTLAGIGTRPLPWLQRTGGWAYALAFVLLFTAGVQPLRWLEGTLYALCGLSFLVGLVASTSATILAEVRRAPQEVFMSWDRLVEAQFEPEMQWAVFVYQEQPTKLGSSGSATYVSLNHLTPAVAGVLWDTIQQHAPASVRADAGVYEWTTRRKILAAVLIGGLVSGAVLLVYFASSHP